MKLLGVKVSNMQSFAGNFVPNQFTIVVEDFIFFQSYDTVIAMKHGDKLYLDENDWNYSRTTSKYRNEFTGLTTKETQEGIKKGSIILADLNKRRGL